MVYHIESTESGRKWQVLLAETSMTTICSSIYEVVRHKSALPDDTSITAVHLYVWGCQTLI